MSSSLRVIGVLVIACLSIFGMLSVAGVISSDALPDSAGKLALAAGVILAAIVGFKILTAGRPDLDKTEPPPQL